MYVTAMHSMRCHVPMRNWVHWLQHISPPAAPVALGMAKFFLPCKAIRALISLAINKGVPVRTPAGPVGVVLP